MSNRTKRVLSTIAGGVAIAIVAGGAPARAEVTDAMTGDEIIAALEAAGLAASLLEDVDSGAPVARVIAGDILYFVRAMDCAGGACSTLLFFANFNLGRDATTDDFGAVNAFNERQVFGRAYVVDGKNEVGVDYVIDLDGGVTRAHVADSIGKWADVVASFRNHFRASRTGS
ncbi:MAG: YbjN domain-containing protein [Pseudomonadota bacterium]